MSLQARAASDRRDDFAHCIDRIAVAALRRTHCDDFKLANGEWVRTANLSETLRAALGGLALSMR